MSQPQPGNELPKVDAASIAANNQWWNLFNALSHEMFFANPKGQQWLQMVEQKYFYAPVAHPGKEFAWATFNEGRNDFIRSIRNAGQKYMNEKQQPETNEPVKTKRTRKQS